MVVTSVNDDDEDLYVSDDDDSDDDDADDSDDDDADLYDDDTTALELLNAVRRVVKSANSSGAEGWKVMTKLCNVLTKPVENPDQFKFRKLKCVPLINLAMLHASCSNPFVTCARRLCSSPVRRRDSTTFAKLLSLDGVPELLRLAGFEAPGSGTAALLLPDENIDDARAVAAELAAACSRHTHATSGSKAP